MIARRLLCRAVAVGLLLAAGPATAASRTPARELSLAERPAPDRSNEKFFRGDLDGLRASRVASTALKASLPTRVRYELVTTRSDLDRVAAELATDSHGTLYFDIETTGAAGEGQTADALDPDKGRPRLLQLRRADGQSWVIDLFATGGLTPAFKTAFEQARLVGQNVLDFDLPFLASHFGVQPREVFDTRTASVVLDGQRPTRSDHSLDTQLAHYFDLALSKQEQVSDWFRPELRPAQVDYAVRDTAFLPALEQAQLARLTREGKLGLAQAAFASQLAALATRGRHTP